jgi:hypothetical protein
VPRPVPALSLKDRVVRWSPDGRAIWLTPVQEIPLRAQRLDIATGRRTPLLTITADRPGVVRLDALTLADDPRAYAYSAREFVSHIFVVQGLK